MKSLDPFNLSEDVEDMLISGEDIQEVDQPPATSLFGNSSINSIPDLIIQNKGTVISIITQAFLAILLVINQPYEIFFCVTLVMFLWYLLSNTIRDFVSSLTVNSEDYGWRTAVVSYVDFISVVMIMFFTQYVTSVAQSEWTKVGFGKWDTVVVGIMIITITVGVIVFITVTPAGTHKKDTLEPMIK